MTIKEGWAKATLINLLPLTITTTISSIFSGKIKGTANRTKDIRSPQNSPKLTAKAPPKESISN